MKAAVIHGQGGPDVLRYEDAADPVPRPDEILIAVEAISIEGGDLHSRAMLPIPRLPHIVGYQAAGRVAAIGADVTGFAIGQRVVGFAFGGSHAELFAAPAATVFAIPDDGDIRLAATIPVPFGTADDALFAAGGLQQGETVLIHGGAGGVGLAAIQLAHRAGATVIATARGARAARLAAHGCDHPIDAAAADYAAETKRLTGGRGADLVIDMVGGDGAAVSRLLSTVAYKGRLSLVGLAGGQAPAVGFWEIIPKNMAVHGILFGLEMGTARGRALVDRHIADAAAGRLAMPIAAEYPLAEAAAAHRFAEDGRPFGRVLLIP